MVKIIPSPPLSWSNLSKRNVGIRILWSAGLPTYPARRPAFLWLPSGHDWIGLLLKKLIPYAEHSGHKVDHELGKKKSLK